MKKILLCLVVMVCLLGVAGTAFGNSGGANIAPFSTGVNNGANYYDYILISNITNSDVTVTITLYFSDGTIIKDIDNNASTGILRATNVSSYSDNLASASQTFTLGAHQTSNMSLINNSSLTYVYGRIEWSQDNSTTNSLLCNGYTSYWLTGAPTTTFLPIIVNGGLPF